MLITDINSLRRFCNEADKASFIAVDTEFLWRRTYWPKLCLIQIATSDRAVAIDPLTNGMDLTILTNLLSNKKILKVFHSAENDIPLLLKATGQMPTPVYDTQIAAMFCNLGKSASYSSLVKAVTNIELDKSQQITDWSQRPLSEVQISYSLNDVIHLRTVYKWISDKLQQLSRTKWALDEMHYLTDPAFYEASANENWRKVKINKPTKEILTVLRELYIWREKQAQRTDRPREWILKDEVLSEIASNLPATRDELLKIVNQKVAHGSYGTALLKAVERGKSIFSTQPPRETERETKLSDPISIALMKVLLQFISQEEGITPTAIATTKEITQLMSEDNPDLRCLKGWRRTIFGEKALALKRGEISLHYRSGKLEINTL